MEAIKRSSTSEAKKKKLKKKNKFETRNNIVQPILKFNQLNQSGKGIKILTPNQMLSRLLTP